MCVKPVAKGEREVADAWRVSEAEEKGMKLQRKRGMRLDWRASKSEKE